MRCARLPYSLSLPLFPSSSLVPLRPHSYLLSLLACRKRNPSFHYHSSDRYAPRHPTPASPLAPSPSHLVLFASSSRLDHLFSFLPLRPCPRLYEPPTSLFLVSLLSSVISALSTPVSLFGSSLSSSRAKPPIFMIPSQSLHRLNPPVLPHPLPPLLVPLPLPPQHPPLLERYPLRARDDRPRPHPVVSPLSTGCDGGRLVVEEVRTGVKACVGKVVFGEVGATEGEGVGGGKLRVG